VFIIDLGASLSCSFSPSCFSCIRCMVGMILVCARFTITVQRKRFRDDLGNRMPVEATGMISFCDHPKSWTRSDLYFVLHLCIYHFQKNRWSCYARADNSHTFIQKSIHYSRFPHIRMLVKSSVAHRHSTASQRNVQDPTLSPLVNLQRPPEALVINSGDTRLGAAWCRFWYLTLCARF
jgi:hypothetical protein